MDFPVESYSFLPGSRAILDLTYRSRLRNSNYTMSQQPRPTIYLWEGAKGYLAFMYKRRRVSSLKNIKRKEEQL